MPLDLSGFRSEPNQWAGLYHAADQLEKRKLRQDQLAQQKESKRTAAGTFLQNWLDPKDRLTGTAYDPMLVQGLQEAMQQGAQLAMAGADAPALMMALGPMVNKINQYSTNAKNVNKQIDERIKGMRESGLTGYNYAALKEQALKNAFYSQDANGQLQLDPDNIDLNQDYVKKAIENNPLEVTTEDVFDEFAKKAEKFETVGDVTTYTPTGTKFRSKAQLISPDYMVPEVDDQGVTTGFVPKHDIATEQGSPLFHTFEQGGKQVRAPVRLLDENFYDKGLKPAMQDRIRGMVQRDIKTYSDKTGKQVDINSPAAKDVGRAIAYDLLNVPSRKGGSIKHIENKGQPSQAQINLKIQQSPEFLQNVEDKAAAAKRGRVSVEDPNNPDQYKSNAAELIGDIFTGKDDVSANPKLKLNGDLFSMSGKSRSVKDYEVIDVTSSMKDGGLKAGRGQNFEYKKVYFNPKERTLIVDQEETLRSGKKATKSIEIPEAQIGQFINQIAEANGIDKRGVRALLDKMGYKNNKFGGTTQAAPAPATTAPAAQPDTPENDYKSRKAKRPWKQSMSVDLKKPFQTK